MGYFPMAIDGSQICTFDQEPWPGCPHRELSNGTMQYFAYVLDAKLVTPCGMALTLATEMLTNEGNEDFDKQDCELKAFPRLVEKLYAFFPRTPLCLLLDGLYANQNVIRLIEAKRWKYIITFKEGSMPERFPEAVALAGMQTAQPPARQQTHKLHSALRMGRSACPSPSSPPTSCSATSSPKTDEATQLRLADELPLCAATTSRTSPTKEVALDGRLKTKASMSRRTTATRCSTPTASTPTGSGSSTSCY